jgi:hypothetical protein
MLCFRASLAFVLSTALAASPAFAARAHHFRTSTHTSSSHASTRASSRASHRVIAKDSASDTTSTRARRGRHSKRGSRSVAAVAPTHRLHGQQSIDSARVTEIQQALIREHYLTGDANGQWDETTKSAMLKFQADQGWQTKLTPDSRALKKLGLGPDYSNAINARNSSFAAPPPISTMHTGQTVGFASASGVNQ